VVEIATRDAVVGDDLETLSGLVLQRMELDADAEALARTQAMRMQMAVMRTIHRYLRGERLPILPSGQTLGGDGHG